MNFIVCNHNSGCCRILNSQLCSPALTTHPPYSARQVIPSKGSQILDLKTLHKYLIHSQQRQGIFDIETQHERVNKVRAFLQVGDIGGVRAGLELNLAGFEIHMDVDLHLVVDLVVNAISVIVVLVIPCFL